MCSDSQLCGMTGAAVTGDRDDPTTEHFAFGVRTESDRRAELKEAPVQLSLAHTRERASPLRCQARTVRPRATARV